MDAVENVLHRQFVLKPAVTSVKAAIPPTQHSPSSRLLSSNPEVALWQCLSEFIRTSVCFNL
jgi:hypothetical protein